MVEAKRRNPAIKLYGLAWGFPGWVSEGGDHPYTNSTAHYITSWILGAKQHYNLTIDYIGSWNEHPTTKEYVLLLRRTLDAANLTATQIVASGATPHTASTTSSHLTPLLPPRFFSHSPSVQSPFLLC